MKRVKQYTAGALVIAVESTETPRRGTEFQRAQAQKCSDQARRLLNFKASFQKLELKMAANFRPGDLWVTFTYEPGRLPRNKQGAKECMKAFWRALRAQRAKRGDPLRYIYVTEQTTDGEGRLHHHALINATGNDFDDLRDIWQRGFVDIRYFRLDREKTFESAARYLTKEPANGAAKKVGERMWSCSRGLKSASAVSYRIPDGQTITPPLGSTVYQDHAYSNGFGGYHYLKYLLPEAQEKAPRGTRKKKGH